MLAGTDAVPTLVNPKMGRTSGPGIQLEHARLNSAPQVSSFSLAGLSYANQ